MALTSKSRRGDSNPEPSVYKTRAFARAGAAGRGAARVPAGSLRVGAGAGGGSRGRAVASGSHRGLPPAPAYLHYDDPEPAPPSFREVLRDSLLNELVWGGVAVAALIVVWDRL
jgi:hypothetical protein